MPKTLELTIKGNALIFPFGSDDNKIWKVLFPFDDIIPNSCHDVKITFLSRLTGRNESINLAQNGKKVKIETGGETSTATSTSDFDNYVFDFSSQKAHGPKGLKRKYSTSAPDSPFVELDIQNGEMECGEISKNKFILFENMDGENLKVKMKKQYMFQSIITTINAEKAEDFTIKIIDSTGNEEILPLDTRGTIRVEIDNDCEKVFYGGNDFQMIYDKLADSKDEKKYKLEWVPDHYHSQLMEGKPVKIEDLKNWQEAGRRSVSVQKLDEFLTEYQSKSSDHFLKGFNFDSNSLQQLSFEKMLEELINVVKTKILNELQFEIMSTTNPTYPCFDYKTDGLE